MPKLNKQNKLWLLSLSLFILFILVSYSLTREEAVDYPDYVVESPAPMGVKAFYQALEQIGLPVEQWAAPPLHLSEEGVGELLIMIEPPTLTNREEKEAYLNYVEAGNTLLIAKNNPSDLFDLETDPISSYSNQSKSLNGKKQFETVTNSPVRLSEAQGHVLLEDDQGIVALEQDYGAGKLVVTVEPDWFVNQAIVDHDHVEAILSLVDFSSFSMIYFDTYRHQSLRNPMVFTVYPDYFLTFSFGLIFIAILMLWKQGKRFGAIIEPREATVRYSDERLQALAYWYLKGRNYQEALRIQLDDLKVAVQERTGLSVHARMEEFIKRLDQLTAKETDASIKGFVEGLNKVLNEKEINKQTFVKWSKEIDQIRKEVE